jgi:hypothetical protein
LTISASASATNSTPRGTVLALCASVSLCPGLLLALRHRRYLWRMLAAILILSSITLWISCGGGGGGKTGGSNPPSSYTVTVKASATNTNSTRIVGTIGVTVAH